MTLRRYRPNPTKRWFALLSSVVTLLLLSVTMVSANLPGSPFDAGDGNLVLNDETQDWVNVPNRQEGFDEPTGQDDDSFGQGTKEDTEVPSIVSGQIPNNKSDLLRFYVANDKVGSDEFLYLAWERVQEPSGTTNMDFEFNQSQTVSANGVTPVRTAGDLLIKYDLAQGGVTPILGYHIWVTAQSASEDPDIPDTAAAACEATNKFPCWGKVQDLSGDFEGSINTVVVTDPIPPDEPRDLSVRTFGEAAINLSASGIFDSEICQGFGSAYLKSRSSDSFTAALKDFIAPVPVEISNCGNIVVQKVTDPTGDSTLFSFQASWYGDGSESYDFQLADGQSDDSGPLQAGTYSVSELAQTGWDLTSATCDDGSNPASISLQADETVTCTFTNTARGNIIVDKVTDPTGETDLFSFQASWLGDGTETYDFQLADATAAHDSGPLAPGQYSVSELALAGWDQTSATCDDGSDPGTINLGAGETVTCTFTNTKHGTIVIAKETDPDDDPATFTFTGDVSGTLSDGQSASQEVSAGSYSSAETVPSGWDLTDVSCNDSDSTGSTTNATASFVVSPGETVTCTFTNTKDAFIVTEKQTDPDGSDASFEFNPSWGDNFFLGDGDQDNSGDLDPGGYDVSEIVPDGWDLIDTTCTSSNSDSETAGDIDLQAGETVTCVFTNQADTGITVIKQTDPDGDPQVFTFSADYDADGFGLSDGQSNNSGDLDPDSYDIAEVVPSGWDLDNIVCEGDDDVEYGDGTTFDDTFDLGSDTTARVDLDAGESVTCTFTNEKDATITIVKQTDHQDDTTLFDFNANWDSGDPPDFQLADDDEQSSGDLDPSVYDAAETVPSGWRLTNIVCTSDVSGPITIGDGTDDDEDGNPFDPGDTGFTVDLDAGENVTCTFTNTRVYKVYVITCDDATDEIVISAVSLDGGTTAVATLSEADLAGILDPGENVCDIDPTFGDLFAGDYVMDLELPDVVGGLEP